MTTNTNTTRFNTNAHYVGATKGGYHIVAINGRTTKIIARFDSYDAMSAAMTLVVTALDAADAAA